MRALSIVEAVWATHEGFRRFGFSPEDLYVVVETNDPIVHVRLVQGEITFDFRVGSRGAQSRDEFAAAWTAYVKKANSSAITELDDIYDVWLAHLDTVGLFFALERKGIVIPKLAGIGE